MKEKRNELYDAHNLHLKNVLFSLTNCSNDILNINRFSKKAGETNAYVNKMVNLGGRILNLVDVEKLLVEIENYFA